MKWWRNTFFAWLPIAVAISGMSVLVYGAVQQNYRQSLNDPQAEIAEDIADALAHGATPTEVVGDGPKIDMSKSLAPFVEIYDAAGQPVAYSGVLGATAPKPPQGVFDAARTGTGKDTLQPNENRVTWEPAVGVREASVVVYYSGEKGSGFVLVGRNMREVEKRESDLGNMVIVAWIGTLVVSLAAQALKGVL